MTRKPLIIDGAAPILLPAYGMPTQKRESRSLYVIQRPIHFRTSRGWVRVPRGYVTDFASIPRLAAWRIHPFDAHAWAALLHDWFYAIGEPGQKPVADGLFLERMRVDSVWAARREVMFRAVQIGGGGGYAKAKTWWQDANFVDPDTGSPCPPPFAREDAFAGAPHGLRPFPDWP